MTMPKEPITNEPDVSSPVYNEFLKDLMKVRVPRECNEDQLESA